MSQYYLNRIEAKTVTFNPASSNCNLQPVTTQLAALSNPEQGVFTSKGLGIKAIKYNYEQSHRSTEFGCLRVNVVWR